jgi:MATE family, multidrug efflux pump
MPLAVHSSENKATLKPVLRLALPVVAEQFLSMLVGFSDTMLTGWYLSRDHLAAVNLMTYAIWLLLNLFVFITIGATALVARFTGARQLAMASRAANQAVLLGVAFAVPATVAGLTLGGHLVDAMQLSGEAAALALSYWKILMPCAPAIMLISVGVACLRGGGDTVSGLVIMSAVNVVNVALSWGLMLGWGPLPKLGWDGIAWGTCIGYVVGGVLMVALLVRGRAELKLRLVDLRPDLNLMRRILRIGVPGGVDVSAIIGCQMWYLALVNGLGPLAAAAHGIAIRIESIAYLPGTGFQVAAGTLAGQHLGAGDRKGANRSVVLATIVGLLVISAGGVVLYTAANPLARAFLRPDEYEVARTAAPLLQTVALVMPALALMMILTGALRGAGDTRWPLLFTLIGFLVVRIPATYALTAWWTLGVQGAWYAMALDIVVRCLLVVYRFWHGGWSHVQV